MPVRPASGKLSLFLRLCALLLLITNSCAPTFARHMPMRHPARTTRSMYQISTPLRIIRRVPQNFLYGPSTLIVILSPKCAC